MAVASVQPQKLTLQQLQPDVPFGGVVARRQDAR